VEPTPSTNQGIDSASSSALSALIVDDQRELAELLAERLSVEGIECTVVTTAADGLRECSSKSFDVAFVDLKLPDMSGVAIAAELKGMLTDLKVILMSGFAASLDDVDVGASHLDGVLPKPWRPTELEAILRNIGRQRS
jgi:DNA-binding response OmpR family regulator